MLAYILALAVGLGSLAIYMAAFFFPEIHRKNDFVWSGVGLFYALVLWVCAGRITGGLLLGQVAGVALLGWSVTQTLSLRRQLTPREQQTELPSTEEVKNTVQEKVSNLSLKQRLSQLQQRVTGSVTGVKDRVQDTLKKTPEAKTTQPPTTVPTAATGEAVPASSVLNAPLPPPIDAIEQDEDNPVQIIDKRTPIPDQPADIAATEQLTTDTGAATESVPDAKSQPSTGEQEGSSELIRPNPPDPELVEAAIRDAEEKSEDFSPPESVDTDSAQPLKKEESQEENP